MGRRSDREIVEDSKVLDVFFLKDNGYLSGRKSGSITWRLRDIVTGRIGLSVTTTGDEGSMKLSYSITDRGTRESRAFDYPVRLVMTGCSYGGGRWWFRCPIGGCWKRVAKLYLPPGGSMFGCRRCHGLTYESCRMSHSALSRLAKENGMTLGELGKGLRL